MIVYNLVRKIFVLIDKGFYVFDLNLIICYLLENID